MLVFVLLMTFAYFLGAIPFGLLFGRLFADVDIRDFGSKNIGATNVNRVLGRKLGAATLAADVLKGMLPIVLGMLMHLSAYQVLWVGVAAFVGHIFPIYLRFNGGKGVATAFGVILLTSFWSGLIGLGIWILVVRLSKISALGALIASLSVPVSTYFLNPDHRFALVTLGMMSLVIYRHKENIQRLRKGEENPLKT